MSDLDYLDSVYFWVKGTGPQPDVPDFNYRKRLGLSHKKNKTMTYQEFQSEVAHIWNTSTDAGFAVEFCDGAVKRLLHTYAWEVGKMEHEGKTKQQQVAFLWSKFKQDYPHRVK